MTQYTISFAAIIPAAQRENARRLAWAIGHDEPPLTSYSAALSADGSEPATHYGLHTHVRQEFLDMLTAAAGGSLPPIDWAQYDITEQDVYAVLDAMAYEAVDGGTVSDTWPVLLSRTGLQEVDANGV